MTQLSPKQSTTRKEIELSDSLACNSLTKLFHQYCADQRSPSEQIFTPQNKLAREHNKPHNKSSGAADRNLLCGVFLLGRNQIIDKHQSC